MGQTGMREMLRSGFAHIRHSSGKTRLKAIAGRFRRTYRAALFGAKVVDRTVRVERLGKTHPR